MKPVKRVKTSSDVARTKTYLIPHLRRMFKNFQFHLIISTCMTTHFMNFFYSLMTGSWLGFNSIDTWYGIACAERMPNWLGDKKYALGTIAFIGIWQSFGFNMVLYLAGLTAVPRTLYKAAEIDGASGSWESFKLVTWPLLGPTHVFVVTITSVEFSIT